MRCDASQIQSAAIRLILSLALSLALHLALAFLVQVKPADRFNARARALQVHLPKRLAADSRQAGETPSPATAPVSVQPPAPKLARKTSAPPSQPAAAPPAPVPTAPAAAPLPAANAQAKEEPANDTAAPPAQAMLLPQSPLPAVDIPLIEDPTYYTAKQVDIHPMAVEAIKPEYPEAAAAAGIEGFVTLRLLIDATGVVREISVVEAQPPDTFETAAVNAFRNARFIAAQRNDRPVKSDVRIKVMFEIIETTGARGAE